MQMDAYLSRARPQLPQKSPELVAALHAAVHEGRPEAVKSLLRARVDVNARDADGATPLCVACQSGVLTVVQLLSAYGARRAHVLENAGLFAEEAAVRSPGFELTRSDLAGTARLPPDCSLCGGSYDG